MFEIIQVLKHRNLNSFEKVIAIVFLPLALSFHTIYGLNEVHHEVNHLPSLTCLPSKESGNVRNIFFRPSAFVADKSMFATTITVHTSKLSKKY